MFPLSPHNYFEIAALLTCVLFWLWLRKPLLLWLTLFLIFIVTVELTGRYIGRVLKEANYQLYNFSVPVEYLFFAFLFYRFFKTASYHRVAGWFLVIFPLFALVNFFFIEGPDIFNTNFLKVGSLCMIILACLYFIEILKLEQLINPLVQPMFWIATGIFLFNTGEFVNNSLSHVLFANWKNWMATVSKINHSLIYILYSCIILAAISFLWDKQEI
jgi:hypothetical protein